MNLQCKRVKQIRNKKDAENISIHELNTVFFGIDYPLMVFRSVREDLTLLPPPSAKSPVPGFETGPTACR